MKLNPGFRALCLLPPARAQIPASFRNVTSEPDQHERLLRQMQRLRGSVYLQDGAIGTADLMKDGRHETSSDKRSWHLLLLDGAGDVCGCLRYLLHTAETDFSQLIASETPLATCRTWRSVLTSSVKTELELAKALDVPFIEVGGWAIREELRKTVEALRMVLATYAFSREFGGAIGFTTATVRHSSSSILRRIGGLSLEANGATIPPYEDPHYNCRMEMLRFYSWAPNARYTDWIRDLGRVLRSIPVICPDTPTWQNWVTPGYQLGQTDSAYASAG
jgi:hypothetical protein